MFGAETGSIQGTVSSATSGGLLQGAEVSVETLGLRTLTARDGSFTLSGLPSGSHEISVAYTGFQISRQYVQVAPGQAARVVVDLSSPIYTLGEFVVASEREGEAASINKQRRADNIVNVVAIESFGDVADGNIGNFMARLSGVAAEESSNGDIIGIKIRGTPAELSAVNLDGVRVSNAVAGFSPMGDRAAMIDQFPAEFIKEIEVHKGLIPEMPADSIGGATNLITKSALDFKESVLTYKAGASYNTYRDNLGNFKPTGTLTYMTKVGKERPLGVTLSLSYSVTEMPRDRVSFARTTANGTAGEARTLAEVNTRERAGAGLKFDYNLDEHTLLTVKFNYSMYRYEGMREIANAVASGGRRIADYNRVSRAQIESGTAPRDSANATAGVAPGWTDDYTELLNATWTNAVGYVDRLGRNYLGDISLRRKLPGDQTLSFQASYNPSWFDADLPTFTTTLTNGVTTAASGIGMIIDGREDLSRPKFIQSYGPSVAAGGSPVTLYTGVFSYGRSRTEEEIANVQLNYVKDWKSGRNPVQFKSGINFRSQHRLAESNPSGSFRLVGQDGVAMRNSATGINDDFALLSVEPGYGLFNTYYPRRDKFDIFQVARLFAEQPSYFVQTASGQASRNEVTEDVYAAYVQLRAQFGRASVLGGVRYEETQVEASGRVTDRLNPTLERVMVTRKYDDFFPSLHLTYRLMENLLARASFSTGFARPSMAQLYPTTTVSYDSDETDGTVTRNDPGLKPQQSKNYDLSLEYYLNPSGVLSVGVFRKDLTDFLARSTTVIGSGSDNGFDGFYSGFDLVTTTNQGRAKIQGVELNYSQQLTMLPRPFDGLQVFANLTDLSTRGEYEEGADRLARFVPRTANVGLAYKWKKLQVRVTERYTSAYLNAYSTNAFARQYFESDRKLDLSFKYQLRRGVALYFDVLNVFNTWPDQYTADDPRRVNFSNVYGTKLNMGVSGRF